MTGLYDHQGVLRYSGRDNVECLEYAELFCLDAGSYILASLEKHDPDPAGLLSVTVPPVSPSSQPTVPFH